jgi:pyruvate kinase
MKDKEMNAMELFLPDHKTKIVATIGPACENPEVLKAMMAAGMNVARLNFSHGDFASHRRVIGLVRAAAREAGRQVAILGDLPGPKIRLGQIAGEPVQLKPGDIFTLVAREITGNQERASVTLPNLPQAVKPGDTLLLSDGLLQFEVVESRGDEVRCRVVVGGELRSRKGVNLPGIDLGVCAFTPYDRECLEFALQEGVDAVSQSFVESGSDIRAVHQAAQDLGHQPFVIAKIERAGALKHLDDILEAADGIMIARGDLGVEIPIEDIARVQKQLMRQANLAGKPVITATQMLESMVSNRRPTRAEATDAANAILDGTDCVMLSEESAMGQYPVEAVSMLARIAAAIEPMRPGPEVRRLLRTTMVGGQASFPELITLSVDAILERGAPGAVFIPTRSGATARSLARFRPPVWIVAVSSRKATCQQLLFSFGVHPVWEPHHPEDWTAYIRRWAADLKLAGDFAVLTEGPSSRHPEANNRMELVSLK